MRILPYRSFLILTTFKCAFRPCLDRGERAFHTLPSAFDLDPRFGPRPTVSPKLGGLLFFKYVIGSVRYLVLLYLVKIYKTKII